MSIIDDMWQPPLRPGTRVRLPDGSIGAATPDRAVARPWDGVTYRVRRAGRIDYFTRSSLVELEVAS